MGIPDQHDRHASQPVIGDGGSSGGGGEGEALTFCARIDRWMATHPWHPRLVPFAVYGGFIALIGFSRERWAVSYPLMYAVQCLVVLVLLVRYRKLLPELNWKFHWLSVPVGVLVFWVWVWLGIFSSQNERVMREGLWAFSVNLTSWMIDPPSVPGYGSSDKATLFEEVPLAVGWVSFSLRLVGMSVVVPMFEELFIRSLMLRSLSRFRQTGIGIIQVAQDMPVVGDMILHTNWSARAHRHPPVFGSEFLNTPLGKLTFWGVLASTVVFTLSHVPRDWAGAVFCGTAYCLLLAATAKKGLGPVIWAHGITNALLWYYTLHTGDWQFL